MRWWNASSWSVDSAGGDIADDGDDCPGVGNPDQSDTDDGGAASERGHDIGSKEP